MDKIIYKNQVDYIKKLRNVTDPLIEEMELFAHENNVPILDWQSASFLELLIRIMKPVRVLEIGTAIAYSSIRIAKNLAGNAVVHTIEKSSDNVLQANENIRKAGLQKKIKIFEGNAFDIIPSLKKKYDLIFLDADKQDYKALLDLSMNALKKNGVLFVDNMLWHGYAAADVIPEKHKTSTENIREFNHLFMSHPRLKTTILSIGDGIGLGIKTKKKDND